MAAAACTHGLAAGFSAVLLLCACRPGNDGRANDDRVLVLYNAGSLALPLRTAFDSFAVGRNISLQQESAGSLESARKITELGKTPDVIALADIEIFPQLLVPDFTRWYVAFARNRMVLAYRPSSRFAGQVDSTNWWRILDSDSVNVGRSDPNQDPNGYRTLLALRLAERRHGPPGLANRLLQRWGTRYIRPKEADLVALLQVGELDYIWSYESMARAAKLPFVRLGNAVDLGNPADSAFYRLESVRVTGRNRTDSLTITGAPIMYALSIPSAAPHRHLADEFVRYLVIGDGRRVLRAAQLDALDSGLVVGGTPDGSPLFFPAAEPPKREPRP